MPDRAPATGEPARWGPLLTTAVVFFLAEMGDKTQLATTALGARFEVAGLVTVGTTPGMLAADGLVVFGGARLTRVVSPTRLRRVAAGLFLVLGLIALVCALPTVRRHYPHLSTGFPVSPGYPHVGDNRARYPNS